MMNDMMMFPNTVEEFMRQYRVVDTEGIYMSKGVELVPIFRMRQWFEHLPSAQPERKTGKWIERSVDVDGKKSIEEWQSAKCSVCGLYHTTPYLYYFDDFNFCPNCGARMEGSNGNNP